MLSTVATDALVLQHQAIGIHSADQITILLAQLHKKYYINGEQHQKIGINF